MPPFELKPLTCNSRLMPCEPPTSNGSLVVVDSGWRRDIERIPSMSGMGEEGMRKTAGALMGALGFLVADKGCTGMSLDTELLGK